ncbi:hypothetical protein BN7_6061 [Wickerhamomyces ciferrii]|uniref:Uncharacterized protein n=1 Tax=Wickerhamomyces ciferrii (strain ATCC 14091 / BCRC 22168 / CBS 111 / JCM 3599 / NBRC 0793 / NRRL Y-1031 F-60-10) TaxID=1206466 RepID=K0KZA9_WICCF|nr:uncharacterized protein BN7_6061 [Wickerhamomyces ciferrii]CCH46468.1 hypothetical protein BN7_6061 [Wickerhamomyces ciferrii]
MSQAEYQPTDLSPGSPQTNEHRNHIDNLRINGTIGKFQELDSVSSSSYFESVDDNGDQNSVLSERPSPMDSTSRPLTTVSRATTSRIDEDSAVYRDDYSSAGMTSSISTGNSSAALSTASSSSYSFGNLFSSGKFGGKQGGYQLSSSSIHLKISKLNKLEKKKIQKQKELMNEIQNWINLLVNKECKSILEEYLISLQLEVESSEILMTKRAQINQQLLSVSKREKRKNELNSKSIKIMTKLRDTEHKIGTTPIYELSKESYDEVQATLRIVNFQLDNCIQLGLKDTIKDYLISNKNQSIKQYRKSLEIVELPSYKKIQPKEEKNLIDPRGDYGSNPNSSNVPQLINNNSSISNVQRMALQNRFRDFTANSNNNSSNPTAPSTLMGKYHGESPTTITKTLDNSFNEESLNVNKDLHSSHKINNNQNHQNSSSSSASSLQKTTSPNIQGIGLNTKDKHQYNDTNKTGTSINLSKLEIEKLRINEISGHGSKNNSAFYTGIQSGNLNSGPPPTASSNKTLTMISDNSSDNDLSNTIISQYGTNHIPGALGMIRPPSQQNDWASS